jgi:uncharacterized protein YneF (UPF0154 family)
MNYIPDILIGENFFLVKQFNRKIRKNPQKEEKGLRGQGSGTKK